MPLKKPPTKIKAVAKSQQQKQGKEKLSESDKLFARASKTMIQFKLGDEKKKNDGVPKKMKIKTGFDTVEHKIDVVELKTEVSTEQLYGSPEESSSNPTSSSISVEEIIENEDDAKEEEEDESETVSTEESIHQEPVKTELELIEEFFNNFMEMPDLDEISLTPSDKLIHLQEQIEELHDVTVDDGKFMKLVDDAPSDIVEEYAQVEHIGEHIEKEEEEKIVETEEAEEEEEEDVTCPAEVDFSFDFNENDKIFESLVDDGPSSTAHKKKDCDVAFVNFLSLNDNISDEIHSEIDLGEKIFREEEANFIKQLTSQFLYELINKCVAKCELIDKTILLRRHINKRSVINELKELLPHYYTEQWVRQFLNRKCVEHFRRIKAFRRITENPKNSGPESERHFLNSLELLDEVLGFEKETVEQTDYIKSTLQKQFEELESESNEEIEKLQSLMIHSLNPNNFPKIQAQILNWMKRMDSVRKEISKWRFELLIKQHVVATLLKDLNKLEIIGDGLSMATYDTLQTEYTTLNKKLEERTSDLNRLRYRCHSDIHVMAHLKGKGKMIRDTIAIQKSFLDKKQWEKDNLRERIISLKAQRSKTRKEIRECSFQSGLLDHPALLTDYNNTVKEYYKRRRTLFKLKATVKQKAKKIENLIENKCKPMQDGEIVLNRKNF